MFFIVTAILGAVNVACKAIDALDEHTIQQAPKSMQPVVRSKASLYDRCPSLPLHVCQRLGIDDLADEKDKDTGTCLFLVSWTDEDAGTADRCMTAIMQGSGNIDARVKLRRIFRDGQERFRHIGREMDKQGMPKHS